METTWLRWLRLLLGGTASAASATLVATFLGQALGATLGAALAVRTAPLRTLGAAVLIAAALCAAVPALLELGRQALDPGYDAVRQSPALLTCLRLGVALLATLPAATALGTLLPLAFQAGVANERLGASGGVLYALETAGAALGVALASFALPPRLGVSGSYAVGVGVLAAVGLVVALRARGAPAVEPAAEVGAPARRLPVAPALLGLAALSGFGSFAAQVLLVQSFALVHNQSTHAFGSVLVVVLLGLALAALCTGLAVRRGVAGGGLLAAGLGLGALALATFPLLFTQATGGLRYLVTDAPWPGYLLRALGLAALAAGPLLVCTGLVLPAVMAVAGERAGSPAAGARMGALLAANTLGAVLGALAGAWLLLPWLGLWQGFFALSAAYAAALAALAPRPRARLQRAALAAAVLAALVAVAGPARLPLVPLRADEELLHAAATPDGLVAVVARDGGRRIQIDNHYLLGGAADRVHQERQGHLPLILRPGARRVAFLGAATGSSASAALAHAPEHLAAVELVPAVTRLARRFLAEDGGAVYDAPVTEVVLDDARNFMRATRERFDVVVADLFLPWRSGAGALYTTEHYAAVRERLLPGGVFCQWLPLYQLSEEEFLLIAASFLDLFPDAALFRGDFFGSHPIAALVGFRDGPAPAAEIAEAARRARRAGVADRWVTHPDGVFALYVGPLHSLADSLRAHPRNSDDWPRLEMEGARRHGGRKPAPFVARRFASFAEQVMGRRGLADPLFPDATDAALRAREGGLALQAAGALYVEGRTREASRAFTRAAMLLPEGLVRQATPDPTAAELWWSEP